MALPPFPAPTAAEILELRKDIGLAGLSFTDQDLAAMMEWSEAKLTAAFAEVAKIPPIYSAHGKVWAVLQYLGTTKTGEHICLAIEAHPAAAPPFPTYMILVPGGSRPISVAP